MVRTYTNISMNPTKKLTNVLLQINEDYGGDVTFINPVSEANFDAFSSLINWQLPEVFRYFYTKESNGIIIGNRKVLSINDTTQKKSRVDNIERHNNPITSPWFKNRPHIFNDYLVIGYDNDICFCLSKKYHLENPSIYICENANSKKGVDLNSLDLDLPDLILQMVINEFE